MLSHPRARKGHANPAVTFDAVKKRMNLEKLSKEPEPITDVQELLEGMRMVMARSGRRKFTAEEKEKILGVSRVLAS